MNRLPLLPFALSTLFPFALGAAFAQSQPMPDADPAPAASQPEIIAHRGSSATVPENTLAAVQWAWNEAAPSAEVDVWLTKDNHIVCLHDATLKRTTGDPRRVTEVTLADLEPLDAGTWKNPRWHGEPVPTLESVLQTIPEGRRLYIEIKDTARLVPPLKDLVERLDVMDRIAVISFDYDACVAAREALPKETPVYLLVGTEKDETTGQYPPIELRWVDIAKEAGFQGLDVSHHGVTPELAQALHARDMRLLVYTVDSPDRAKKLLAQGVDGITTNKPALMLHALNLKPLSDVTHSE